MIGTIANTCTILIGSLVGSALKKGLKEKYQSIFSQIDPVIGGMQQ